MESKRDRRLWMVFGAVCAFILLTVFSLGTLDPKRLVPLLATGGVVESLPAVLLLVTAALAIWLAIRTRGNRLSWLLYGLLCVFLMGEEAEWGEDAVLGWKLRGGAESDGLDVHNLITHNLSAVLPVPAEGSVSIETATLVAGIVLVLAVGFLGVAVALGISASSRHSSAPVVRRFARLGTVAQFVLVGLSLLAVGLVDVLEESLGHPTVPFTWPLEESFELFGSVALLFAAFSALTGGKPDDVSSPR